MQESGHASAVRAIALTALLALCIPAQACWSEAAARYRLSSDLLYAIAAISRSSKERPRRLFCLTNSIIYLFLTSKEVPRKPTKSSTHLIVILIVEFVVGFTACPDNCTV